MKLNLGCGQYKIPGFINVDISDYYNPDVVANVLNLPYENDSVDLIYAGHLIEHLEPEEVFFAIRHWRNILKPGGELWITFPDFEKVFEMWENEWCNWKEVNEVIFGKDRPVGGGEYVYHRQLVSVGTITPFLMGAFGNCTAEEECEYLVARVYWQSTVKAVKPLPEEKKAVESA